jgi:hypothetical protein
MRCWCVSMPALRLLICGHHDTFDSRLWMAWQWHLSPSTPSWTFAWELPGLFGHLQNTFDVRRHREFDIATGGAAWGGLRMKRRLAPNSSPLEVRLNLKEQILWFLVNSPPKVSPPRVGVETKLFVFVTMFCKKVLHVISPHNRLRWLCGDFCVQAWQFFGAVLFEVRCSPWFNDVVLYFWFHAC